MPSWSIEPSPLGRIVVAPELAEGVGLFYTTIDYNGRLDETEAARIAALIEQRFGVNATLATCTQVHGATVERIRASGTWRECDSCDALATSERGVALGIKVADCLPVTIVEAGQEVLANIHSGWRGAARQITSRTIDVLERDFPFRPREAAAYLGPSIRVCCFEVGEEVVAEFQSAFEAFDRFVDRTKAKAHIDLPALTHAILVERGFDPSCIFDSGLCTRCDGSIFHSFRRGGRGGGRNLAIVAQ